LSPNLPVVTGQEVARVAERLGFEFRRQTGNHAIFVRLTDHARLAIPVHSGVAIKPRTLRSIIRDLRVTVEEFARLI
jgi:predicted RNA binding protein YcfA (HicA-like mRNA interferase family)